MFFNRPINNFALRKVHDDVTYNMDYGNVTALILLDLSGARDIIDHVDRMSMGVLRLVWPPILLLFIERRQHFADSNEPNFIKKKVFLNLLNLIGSLGHHQHFTHC